VEVRHADPARDGGACAAIYAPHVLGPATFDEEAPDAAAFARRIAEGERTHPWLVLEHGGAVEGFAYAGPHRARPGYRWACEVSVYVAHDARRAGAGRTLYTALLDLLRRQGLRVALAGIALPNPASVALHEALGFQPVGTFRAIGWKAGAWRDVGWWQLALGPAGRRGPAGAARARRSAWTARARRARPPRPARPARRRGTRPTGARGP
jgi:phosphinothricin acetyltransferase